jgi:L-arabinose isomerase
LKGTVQELFDQLIKIGVTQHYGIVEGDYIAELENLANLLEFDFYRI